MHGWMTLLWRLSSAFFAAEDDLIIRQSAARENTKQFIIISASAHPLVWKSSWLPNKGPGGKELNNLMDRSVMELYR
jgi:hypothetical protein